MSVEMAPRAKSHCTPWPEERTARLRKLIGDRLTASAIARELGVAKGAVSGKARRLGLSIMGGPQPPTQEQILQRQVAKAARDAAAEARRDTRRAAPNTGGARKVAAIRAKAKPRPMPEPPPMLDATHAKPWTERAFGQCAYPISGEGADTFSCGAPTKGHTYCRAHRQVMFAKPTAARVHFHQFPRRVAA